jgi:hypothetical protein
MVGSRARSSNVSSRLVGSVAWSQSRKGCFGFTIIADLFRVTMDGPVLSRCETLVAVVQPAHLRNTNDLTVGHYGSRLGRILRQPKVRPRAMIIGEVVLQQLAKMAMV